MSDFIQYVEIAQMIFRIAALLAFFWGMAIYFVSPDFENRALALGWMILCAGTGGAFYD